MVDDPVWFSGKEHCWGGYKLAGSKPKSDNPPVGPF